MLNFSYCVPYYEGENTDYNSSKHDNIPLKTCFIRTCIEFTASKHQHHDCTQHIKLMDNQIKVSAVTSKANEIEQGTAGERLKCY